MIISTRGRYALRVMIDLAQQDPDSYTPLKEIAARQEISEKYLENIIKTLVTQGFISGLRGKGGGYRLTQSPEKYTVASILNLTEGSLAPVACLEDNVNQCARAPECATLFVWQKLYDAITDVVDNITIEDIINHSRNISANDYVI